MCYAITLGCLVVLALTRRCLALAVVALQVFSTRALSQRNIGAKLHLKLSAKRPVMSYWHTVNSGIQKMLQADAKDFLMKCDPATCIVEWDIM